MVVIEPHCRLSSVSIAWSVEIICNHACFIISLFLGIGGGASSSEASQIPLFAQAGMPNYDPFTSSFDHNFGRKGYQTFSVQKVPLYYAERACVVFSSFEIHPGRKVML